MPTAATAVEDSDLKLGQTHPHDFTKRLYLEMLPIFMRQNLSIPNHPRLLRELRLLERRASRAGKDVVDHGPHGSDDYCNSLAVCLCSLAKAIDIKMSWVSGEEDPNENGRQSHGAQMLTNYLASRGIYV